ncbi:hypothetical protein Tco_1066864 [Tanacetum coccineum]|uniref:Uncharacterized protein n=1 Tax=Tanacetum coccineum TaxID=301880 RepID=A0ABQ5HD57_9ASTR
MFQRLSRYPTSVCMFPDPILFLAGLKPSWEHEMDFRNFIYIEHDEDLAFFPKEASSGFGTGSPSISVNTEPLKANEEPKIQPVKVTSDSGGSPKPELFVVHPGSIAARIKDRKCKIRGWSSRPPVKRKLASGSSTSRATRSKTSSSKDDATFLTVSDDDEGLLDVSELKDAAVYRCDARQVVVYNAVNRRSRELLHVIEKLRGECDVIRSRERAREEESEGLRVKCEAAMTRFEKNPTVVALQEKIYVLSAESKVTSLEAEKARLEVVKVSLRNEVEELKEDMREVVSKVVPYVAMELVHSDEIGSLVGKLASSTMVYGRCRAFEQVSNDLATASFPWLNEFVADPSALIESLLSKKPPTLQRPAPSKTQVPLPSF